MNSSDGEGEEHNCFLQMVFASGHCDEAMPNVAIFAAEDIAPLTELLFDYNYKLAL